ncbi:MAG TPA: AIPR family protein [bacterium]|nr:AIPR family protein [bacterium]
MTEHALPLKKFKELVQDEVGEICKNKNWDYSNNEKRGIAFQIWTAQLLAYSEGYEEEEIEECILKSKDLKADVYLEDSVRKHILIGQCKFEGLSKKHSENVAEEEVNDFFNRHSLFLDRSWVNKHGSEAIIDKIGDYRDKVEDGYAISYYFVTTASASERVSAIVDKKNKEYEAQSLPVTCYLIDISGLKEHYQRSKSYEENIVEKVEIQLPAEKYIECVNELQYPTIITLLKGNALRNLYKGSGKERLFARNIRGFLGKRGINKSIIETANKQPGNFYYFNNGISAICTDYDIDKTTNKLTAKDFQIINGAQTVGALYRAEENPRLYVLFRLTKTLNVKSEKGFNAEIILYNNTQNIIKISDFKANDPIQRWLESEFSKFRPEPPLSTLTYQRKRSFKKGSGLVLTLEELARIRYAFLYEPTLVHAAPKDLWTSEEDNGVYEKAFGLDGVMVDNWPKEDFNQCLNAISFFEKILDTTKTHIREHPEHSFLRRFRYHALALVSVYLKQHKESNNGKKFIKEKEHDLIFKQLWQEIATLFLDLYIDEIKDKNISLHALIRNNDKWEKLKNKFSNRLVIKKL